MFIFQNYWGKVYILSRFESTSAVEKVAMTVTQGKIRDLAVSFSTVEAVHGLPTSRKEDDDEEKEEKTLLRRKWCSYLFAYS